MINKKVLVSLFTIGLLACTASAGTWAYFQDTITSNGNGVTIDRLSTQYREDGNWAPTPIDPSNGLTITGLTASNIVPSTSNTQTIIKDLAIGNYNDPSYNDDVYLKVTPVSSPTIAGLKIYVGNTKIYDGDSGGFDSTYTSTSARIVSGLGSYQVQDLSTSYLYTDTGTSQNSGEGQAVSFNFNVYIVPQDGGHS